MKITIAFTFLVMITGGAFAQKDSQATKKQSTAPRPKAGTDTVTGKKQLMIRICAPSRGQLLHVPMYVIYAQNQIIHQSDTLNNTPLSNVPPDYIKSITVLKDADAISKYGNIAKNGAIEIYIKDEKQAEIRKLFRADKP